MSNELREPTGNLNPLYQQYERQKCFVGYSLDTSWSEDLVEACNEVLPEFAMEPWYAAEHFAPTQSLREKVVEMIANTHYGLYDLSQWREKDANTWHLPRNVLLELGIAIALNRPLLMLRHTSNRVAQLKLPHYLESLSSSIIEFSGLTTLKRALRERLSQRQSTEPEKDWWNRYCTFGDRSCKHREDHPQLRQWSQEKLHCHISDGQDVDRADFRADVEEVLGRYNDLTFKYLDSFWGPPEGYTFLLCGLCQAIRSSPFAIYRISEQTPAETFIAIGMSLALETQFEQKIPKLLLTAGTEDIPSLLAGYDVVVAQSDKQRYHLLRKFAPNIIRQVRKSTWKARPLPFIEVKPQPDELSAQAAPSDEKASEDYLARLGKYGLVKQLGESELAVTYLARDTESEQLCVIKRLHSSLLSDSRSVTRFHRQAEVLSRLKDPHIADSIEYSEDGNVPYFVREYVEGQTLAQLAKATGAMEALRAINYVRQVAEGLNAAYLLRLIHGDIRPENILIDQQNQVKIFGFGSAEEREVDERTITHTRPRTISVYGIAPETIEHSRPTDIRADLYLLGSVLFHLLAGQPVFTGETIVDIVVQHINDAVPSLCPLRPALPGVCDLFLRKAMSKSPAYRYQTPGEFIAALDQLQQAIELAPPDNRTYLPIDEAEHLPSLTGDRGLPPLVGKTLDRYSIFDYLGSNGLSEVFKVYEPEAARTATLRIFSPSFFALKASDGTDSIASFLRHLERIALLAHPRLVSVSHCGRWENTMQYSVEEFLDGGSLSRKSRTGIGQRKAVEYVLQAAEGLAWLHLNDLLHLDVQPGNMLLRGNDQVLLSNWYTLPAFKAAEIPLTYPFHYQAPEEIANEAIDQRSNVYSLGVVLFEFLAGDNFSPFLFDREQFPIWYLRSPGVPVAFQQIVVKMMQAQPVKRYQSMQEVIEALQAALATDEQWLDQVGLTENTGMEHCAFCNATTTAQDEFCPNCTRRLLPERGKQPEAVGWGQLPGYDAYIKLALCPNCGANFQPGNVICPNCGNALPELTGNPEFPTYPGENIIASPAQPDAPARYCINCGALRNQGSELCESCGYRTPTPLFCPYCGNATRPGDDLCLSCGNHLLEEWAIPAEPRRTMFQNQWGSSVSSNAWGAPPASSAWEESPDPWVSQPPPDSWRASPVAHSWEAPTIPAEDPRPGEVEAEKIIPASPATGSENAPVPTFSSGQFMTGTGEFSLSAFSQENLNNIGKIFGDYRILRDIGQGGLGRVYLALHRITYEAAAIKLFYSHLNERQRQNLFFIQAQVLEHLNHPFILPIIEINLEADPHYLITKYAALGSLHERIQSGQPLPLGDAVTILSQVGQALTHIHQHNIIHRDLKPGNILFNEQNDALLSDFDIAVMLDTGESKKVNQWGSPPYMAPEQFEGMASRKSDQYSLGCIAYRLFTGHRPFDDNSFLALQYKHTKQEPLAPRQLNPDLPAYLERAILMAMAKDPAHRHADVSAFVAALNAPMT